MHSSLTQEHFDYIIGPNFLQKKTVLSYGHENPDFIIDDHCNFIQ